MLYFFVLVIMFHFLMEPSSQQTSPAIPIAIIVGFAMIALAIFFTNKNDPAPIKQITQADNEIQQGDGQPRPVTEADYIRGNPNAPILMVEYSDYDCPFCKQYHNTMNQIMDEYGVTGRVAWVYRQFPIAELHPNAPKISKAALCVGELGGNDAFWNFSDLIFEERSIEEPTNVTKLPTYAERAGVSRVEYIKCMEDDRMEESVIKSIEDGFNAGARGTPYTVLIVGNEEAVINGAQPYEVVKGIIANIIDQYEGNFDAESATTPGAGPVGNQEVPVAE